MQTHFERNLDQSFEYCSQLFLVGLSTHTDFMSPPSTLCLLVNLQDKRRLLLPHFPLFVTRKSANTNRPAPGIAIDVYIHIPISLYKAMYDLGTYTTSAVGTIISS
jgi:hypothetical protein